MGILTVGIVTKPLYLKAANAWKKPELPGLENVALTPLIVIPNERLKQIADTKITLANAFAEWTMGLSTRVQSISDLINGTGLVNLDCDVTAVMQNAGAAHMGARYGQSKDKAG